MQHGIISNERAATLCVLRISIEVLKMDNVVLADQNASSDYVRFLSPNQIRFIDFDLVFAADWTHPDDKISYYRHKAATEEPSEIITSPGVLMVLFCIAGFVAAIKSKPMIMLIVSLLSFCPIGWYMLASPGIFNWIGWLNIVYFFSAIGMFFCYKRK